MAFCRKSIQHENKRIQNRAVKTKSEKHGGQRKYICRNKKPYVIGHLWTKSAHPLIVKFYLSSSDPLYSYMGH